MDLANYKLFARRNGHAGVPLTKKIDFFFVLDNIAATPIGICLLRLCGYVVHDTHYSDHCFNVLNLQL